MHAQKGLLLLFAATMFLAGGSSFLGRTVRDALFLAHFDRAALAYMYVTAALAVAVPGLVHARFAHRMPKGRLLIGFQAAALAVFLAFGSAAALGPASLIALYNFVELYAVLSTLQLMTLAGDCFSTREAKRAFPVMGAAGIFGAISFGLASSALLRLKILATGELLYLVGALIAANLLVAMTIVRRAGGARTAQARRTGPGPWQVLGSKHVRLVAALAVASAFIVSLVDYQFKALAQAHFSAGGPLRVDELSAFYGVFFAVTYLSAAVLQVLVTGRLMQRAGVVPALSLFPGAMIAGSAALLSGLWPPFNLGVVLKGGDGLLRFGLYNSAFEVLFLALPAALRARAKTLVDAVLQPAAGAAAGLLISVVVNRLGVAPQQLAFASLAGGLVWLGLIVALRKGYLEELLAGLRRSRVGIGGVSLQHAAGEEDRALVPLRAGLRSNAPEEIRLMLELAAPSHVAGLTDELHRALARPEPDLRALAARLLRHHPDAEQVRRLAALVDDPTEEVRAPAILAIGRVPDPALHRVLVPLLDSPSPRVRASAAAVFIAGEVPGGAGRGEAVLEALAESEDELDRRAAAEALQVLADRRRHRPLIGLLNDGSVAVQRAAIGAAAEMKSPELLPLLVYLLGQSKTRHAAAAALARCGRLAVAELGRVLNDARESLVVRRAIPRILAHVPEREALDHLLTALGSSDRRIRRDAARAAAQVSQRLGQRLPEAVVRSHLNAEMRRCLQYVAVLSDLGAVVGSAGQDMLREALEEYVRQGKDNLLCLLALLYPPAAIDSIRASLASDDRSLTANALEALESLLTPRDRKLLLPLYERGPAELPELPASLDPAIRRQTAQAWLREFLTSEDLWLVTVALHAVAELGDTSLLETVRGLVRHDHAPVREAAARALSCMLPAPEFLRECAHLHDDGSAQVRAYARVLFAQAGTPAEATGRLRRTRPAPSAPAPARSVAPDASADPLETLAQAVRLAVLLRLEGQTLAVHGVASRQRLPAAQGAPIPLGEPSIFQRAVAARALVLDEVDEVTEPETAFLRQYGLAAPVARAIIPLTEAGALRGVLYIDDDARTISSAQLEGALALAQELTRRL